MINQFLRECVQIATKVRYSGGVRMLRQHHIASTWMIAALITISFCWLPQQARAQVKKGAIKGTVTDTSSGILKGAQISLDPLGTSASTDVQGQFVINNLDPGNYTLTVTYVGFAAFTKQVT